MNTQIALLSRTLRIFLKRTPLLTLLILMASLPGPGPRPALAQADAAPAGQGGRQFASASAPQAFQAQIGRLVLKNFELVKALAADDPAAAGRAAGQLDAILRTVDPALLASGAQRREWDRLAKTLQETARMMATAADLKEKRRHFKPFSDALIEVVQTFGVAEAGPVYRVVCPMVSGGKGFWLQPQKAITNPYFGAMMLTCGVILETLAEGTDPRGGPR
jgi:Cu(I)/Ag(I) efflux system membrane fusion protein